MFGTHFYHQRIRKAVAVFGSLFNNLNVIRKNNTGEVISQVKVPLSYAPKRDFIARMDEMLNTETNERQIALKLPRMSFEIVALQHDPTRQMPRNNTCIKAPSTYNGKATQLYSPVPYNVYFQLNVYGKSQDDVLQIIEQIVPYFTPTYTVTVKPLDDFDVKEDTPIALTGLTFSDDYEGSIEQRRSIIYTLDFEMKMNMWANNNTAKSKKIIESATVSVTDMDGNNLFDTKVLANVITGNSGVLATEDAGTITEILKVENIQSAVSTVSASSPTSGVASATIIGVVTSGGTTSANVSWVYTPNPDFSGSDSFVITLNLVDGTSNTVTINTTVTDAVIDGISDAFAITLNTTTAIDVGANDTFESATVVYTIPVGGQPDNGSVTITNSATGAMTYTPETGFVGTDVFTYTATPATGQAENVSVTLTVT